MLNITRYLDKAADALIAGDADAALQHLKHAEAGLGRAFDKAEPGLRERLARLAGLAQAAEQGIADARSLIAGVRTSARNVTTYDRRGEASNVRAARPTLGRF